MQTLISKLAHKVSRQPPARMNRSASVLVTESDRRTFQRSSLHTCAPSSRPPAMTRQGIGFAGCRPLFTSAPRRVLPLDTGIGVNGGRENGGFDFHPPIHGEKNVAQMAAHYEYSIDRPFKDVQHAEWCADEGRAKNNIELAARFEQARIDIQKGSWDKPDNTFRSSMARQLLHVPCERQDLFGSRFEPIYSTYSRPLAETALKRNGTYSMHTGYMCMLQHFRSIADASLHQDGKNPVSLISTCSTRRLTAAGLSITSAELMDSLEGPLRDTLDKEQERRNATGNKVPAIRITDASGHPLNTQTFQARHRRAFEATISRENLDSYKDTGKFTPEARKAVQEVQQLVRGTTAGLPEEASLRRDPTLGHEGQRHRWPTGVI